MRFRTLPALRGAALAALVAILVLVSGAAQGGTVGSNAVQRADAAYSPASEAGGLPLEAVAQATADEAGPGATSLPVEANATIPVLIALAFTNSSALDHLLAAIENPASPHFHQYLTAAELTAEFAPNATDYDGLVGYLAGFAPSSLTSYPDRLAVSFTADPGTLGRILHADVGRYRSLGRSYWATATPPLLPYPVASLVGGISGLGEASGALLRPQASAAPAGRVPGVGRIVPVAGTTSLAPVTIGSVQYLYPSDLQVAYDEEALLDQFGDPQTARLAALVGSGTYEGGTTQHVCGTNLTPGEAVEPYDSADLSSFFDNATPSGEAVSTVVSVPDGWQPPAPASGCLASWDTTGAVAATTAQLEVMGELAPGSTIYAVSAAGPSVVNLQDGLMAVLSPPTSFSVSVQDGLQNVSVVEIGWATNDTPDEPWVEELTTAAARGVTVVAATGDSGDYLHSFRSGSATHADFPATAGTQEVGSLAVGGLTVTLDAATDHLSSQTVWNVSTNDTAEQGPAGSASGISTQYSEPAYQLNSSANLSLKGLGRGVPDVSAVANNTLFTLTVNGTQYLGTNATNGGPFRFAYGTGVASAVVAGLLGEVDYAIHAANGTAVGFLNPALYALADEQFTPPTSAGEVKSTAFGGYDSELPTSPVTDVVTGGNDLYRAGAGYDLASGWGALDAYNTTMYVLRAPGPSYGELSGVRDRVHLTGLEVTSKNPSGGLDRIYNGSIQQDFFLANSLGAPVYWVQSVIYLARTSTGLWAMNFTANLTYPFPALYPTLGVHEAVAPPAGEDERLPLTMTLTTTLSPGSGSTPPQVVFNYGVPASPTLTLNVPGAAFIIGRTGYTYNWQGTSYLDGPKDGFSAPGFLAPQILLVGTPPNWIGTFGAATSGNFSGSVQALGTTAFSPADTGIVSASNLQPAATAINVLYAATAMDSYNFYYTDGASDQGVYEIQAPYYPVEFTQTGVPDGSTWFVNLSTGLVLSGAGSTGSVTTTLQNGSYTWTAAVGLKNWSSTPPTGAFTVAGKATVIALVFGPSVSTVEFKAKGPEKAGRIAFDWTVNITGGPTWTGNATSYETNLSFGTYDYSVSSANASYPPTKKTGSFLAGPSGVVVPVDFALPTFQITFVFDNPKPAPKITISLGGYTDSGVFSTYALTEPKGVYSWSITGLPIEYAALPSHGTVVVNGTPPPIYVKISATGWGPFGLGLIGYILVGVVAGLVAVWTVVFLLRRRRRRRAERAQTEPREPSEPATENPVDEEPPPIPRGRARASRGPDRH